MNAVLELFEFALSAVVVVDVASADVTADVATVDVFAVVVGVAVQTDGAAVAT